MGIWQVEEDSFKQRQIRKRANKQLWIVLNFKTVNNKKNVDQSKKKRQLIFSNLCFNVITYFLLKYRQGYLSKSWKMR